MKKFIFIKPKLFISIENKNKNAEVNFILISGWYIIKLKIKS